MKSEETAENYKSPNRDRDFSNYTTYSLRRMVGDGVNRYYEHYFFQQAKRELSKRLRKNAR